MRRAAFAAAIAAAAGATACEPFDPVEASHESVRQEALQAFDEWRRAAAEGRAEETFLRISERLKSQWVFARLQEGDPLIRAWRGALVGAARTDLDLWWEHCRKYPQERVEILPETVLREPSLARLWKDYFAQQAAEVKFQMSRLEVVDAYVDPTGVSILVRNAFGRQEMYELVPEGGMWRVNHHRVGPGVTAR
jgi:hypothetical protein